MPKGNRLKFNFRTPLNRNGSKPSPLPIFDITGDLGLKAGSLGISKESFNLPGLQTSGSIEDINFKGTFHLRSTGNSLILENGSPPEKRERFGLDGTLKEVVVDLNHLLTSEGEKLKNWKGGDLVKSHLELGARSLVIGDLRKFELLMVPQFHPHKTEPTYSFNIHEVEAYDISMQGIQGKKITLWKNIPFWEYLRGGFPEIGTLAEGIAQLIDPKYQGPQESFLKLGAIFMCNRDGEGLCREKPPELHDSVRRKNYGQPITNLRGFDTALYGVRDDQHLIIRIPGELRITPKEERVLTTHNTPLYIDTHLKDDIRRGEIWYKTDLEEDLEGLPYRMVPIPNPQTPKISSNRTPARSDSSNDSLKLDLKSPRQKKEEKQ